MATAAVAVKKGDNTEQVPKKRGRKSKKELMNIINGISSSSIEEVVSSVETSNVVLNTKNKNVDALSSTTPSVTRRGRKPNSSKILDKNINIVGNGSTANSLSSSSSSSLSSNSAAVAPSQIINSFNQYAIQPNNLPSIILHLKCRVKDTLEENDYSFYDIQNSSHALPTTKAGLNEDSDENTDETTNTNYDNSNIPSKSLQYSQILVQTDELPQYTPMAMGMTANTNMFDTAIQSNGHTHSHSQSDSKQNNQPLTEMQAHQKLKELNKKVKHLDFILSSNIEIKKSACFWCTEPYLGRSFHIPKTFINETYNVYGNFCSLECAAAYLIKNADHQSVIMEQYALLHALYLDYQPNTCNCIKPAPEPRYMLDKYLGNLSIEEYRTLNSSGRHFILLDKPISKMTPEYHEEYSNFKIQEKNIPSASS